MNDLSANPLAIAGLTPFEDILDELERLAREHLLFFRVQVGNVLLQHFWGGDPVAFSSRDSTKDARFELFFEKCEEALARYGLSKAQARTSIRASVVVRTLPPAVAERLFLSQVLELARLRDPTERAKVAGAAIASDWSVKQLRDVVSAVRAGLPMDADEAMPGVQVVEVARDERLPVPGRMVTRAEKLVGDVESWTAAWERVDLSKLRDGQRKRLEVAATALEARVVALRVGLGKG